MKTWKASLPMGLLCAGVALASDAFAQPDVPAMDRALPYTDRHRIDISNLRFFYEGMLIGDMMMLADGMFDAESKWKLTLYQMIRADSRHFQARSAIQLAHLGVPLDEIRALWSPGYVDGIEDARLQAAFLYIDQIATLPADITAETHAALRRHYTDRQIAELIELASFNAANALHDNVLPIPTDQATLDWALQNLGTAGWTPGPNASSSPEEQRRAVFAGEILEQARREYVAAWRPDDLTAPDPAFETDWINILTGYGVSRVIFDGDQDGVEDPFDDFPLDAERWRDGGRPALGQPDTETPPFNIAAYDFRYYTPAATPPSGVPFSDRIMFDTMWTRQNAVGTGRIEDYFPAGDRALPMQFMWQVFVVYQLSSGCVHCQVHGTYSLYGHLQDGFADGVTPDEARPEVLRQILDLFDFERSDLFSDAQKSAFRLARDAGPLPTRTTAAHIADLRRHYTDREIQELLMTLLAAGRLSAGQQSNVTVTDRLSMSWALQNLTPSGWRPGGHIGLPQEQRRYFMSEIAVAGMVAAMSGDTFDFASEWVGRPVPLAVDRDGDGVEDHFDGYPDDATRWEDTDRDGIEDALDADIDGDGLSNDLELQAGTFPYKADSDGDGVIDPEELRVGTDPVDPVSF
ncbi:MAG: hypothetical protein AAGG09_05950 [Pseudomonadota bacterium]